MKKNPQSTSYQTSACHHPLTNKKRALRTLDIQFYSVMQQVCLMLQSWDNLTEHY